MNRFLISADLRTVPSLHPDIVVVGGGIAGLTAALVAAESANVLLLAKGSLEESATYEAQGGIASAVAEPSWEAHLQDTLRAGAGLCDEAMVRLLVSEGIERVEELLRRKILFDREGDRLALTLEGGHSMRRILHANGDSTGRVVHEALAAAAKGLSTLQILENHFAIDLLHHEGRSYGLVCFDTRYGRLLRVEARAVILATGGLGQIYRETTNPEVATGDGFAMAFRAGAELADMEFVQFHPTTLYLAGAPRFLISEAVRGEGAELITLDGKRFMPECHPDAELAPRDVVSQAIIRILQETGASHVLLDLRRLPPDRVRRRFPAITALCAEYGIDVTTMPIPVRPAAHYMMGGVRTDADGRTSVQNLYACGEVACTGVHGANRLASNSLIEGLVFGRRAGLHAAQQMNERKEVYPLSVTHPRPISRNVPLDIDDVMRSLRSLVWRDLGIFRREKTLAEAEETVAFWERYVLAEEFTARAGFEVQNMLTAAKIIARAARRRTESRGAHQRTDFPQTDDAHWKRHLVLTRHDFNNI
ncbi:MAG: L-aspartate oxidase [Planctomycetota bacterium]